MIWYQIVNHQGGVDRVTWKEVKIKVRSDTCQQFVQEAIEKGTRENNIGTTELRVMETASVELAAMDSFAVGDHSQSKDGWKYGQNSYCTAP